MRVINHVAKAVLKYRGDGVIDGCWGDGADGVMIIVIVTIV
jgi:hypothetical protein